MTNLLIWFRSPYGTLVSFCISGTGTVINYGSGTWTGTVKKFLSNNAASINIKKASIFQKNFEEKRKTIPQHWIQLQPEKKYLLIRQVTQKKISRW